MAEKQIQNLLKLVANNPEILNTVKDTAPNMLSNLTGGMFGQKPTVSPSYNPNVSASIKELGSPDNLINSIEGLSYLNSVTTVIIIFLVIWSISMIVSRFLIKDEETKKDLEFVHNNLFGQLGILPIIGSTWVSVMLIVTLIPLTVTLFPKVEGLADSFKNGISEMIKVLPKLI